MSHDQKTGGWSVCALSTDDSRTVGKHNGVR